MLRRRLGGSGSPETGQKCKRFGLRRSTSGHRYPRVAPRSGQRARARNGSVRHLPRKTDRLTIVDMADTITIRSDSETEHALAVLTTDGSSRSAAIRQAVLETAMRKERAAAMRRAVLRMPLGEPDGTDLAAEISRDRGEER